MEYARSALARPTLAMAALPRVAPSTIASIAMEDLRPKNNMACSGIGETSASRIIAQWAAWRRQACAHMFFTALDLDDDSEIHALASLQAVSTMLDASFFCRAGQGESDAHVEQRDTHTHVMRHELQSLSEHRAVSAFAHRDCIEEVSVSITDDQASNRSMPLGAQNNTADSDHHSSTDQVLPDDNHHLENATGNHEIHTLEVQFVNVQSTVPNSNDALQDDVDQEQMNGHDDEYSDSGSSRPEQGSEQYGSSFSSPANNTVREEAGTYGHPNEGEGGAFVDGDDEQHAADELLTRRSASNLLTSGLRESLEQQLMQSYAPRQELGERQMPNTPVSENEDHAEHAINEPNHAGHDTTGQPSFVFTGQGPRRRQWCWTHPESVLQAIQELQVDMAGLYNEINAMQQMLQACMEMHIELQRSIKQEVSAAMNRSIGVQGWAEGQPDDASRCHLVKKGTCCICCDNQIDSLLYRCGHMCTCSKCGSELLNGDGKCPICRAPIVEVVRAYTT